MDTASCATEAVQITEQLIEGVIVALSMLGLFGFVYLVFRP